MTNTIHLPDDLDEKERDQLDELIKDMGLRDFDHDIVIERADMTGTALGALAAAMGRKVPMFFARPAEDGEFAARPTSKEEDVLRNLEAQMRSPNAERLGGATITHEELTFSQRVGNVMVAVDKIGNERKNRSDFEIAETVIRRKSTGELVGSMVRLDDGTWAYNKDA